LPYHIKLRGFKGQFLTLLCKFYLHQNVRAMPGTRCVCLPWARACPPCLEAGTSARAMDHLPYAAFLTLRWSGSPTSQGVQQVRRSAAPGAPGRPEGAACLRAHSCTAWFMVCGHRGYSTGCPGRCSADSGAPQLDFQVRLDVSNVSSTCKLGRAVGASDNALSVAID
jgi:hypothetical protein